MITPLQPEKFFTGQWTGKGEFRMHSILRLVVPDQTVQYKGYTDWLTDNLWMATEEFRLSRAASIHRTTFLQIVEPGRLHMTCDDVPGGADILLHESGFRLTPYLFRTPVAGRHMFVRCIDEASLDDQGVLHDTIKMYSAGIHLATMTMAIVIDRATHVLATGPHNNSLKPWQTTPAQNAGPSAGSSADPPGRTPGTFGRRAGD
jgi:hypothetical protein